MCQMLTMKTQDGNGKKIALIQICRVLLLYKSNNKNEIIDWTTWTRSRPATCFSWLISVDSWPLSLKEGGVFMLLLAQTILFVVANHPPPCWCQDHRCRLEVSCVMRIISVSWQQLWRSSTSKIVFRTFLCVSTENQNAQINSEIWPEPVTDHWFLMWTQTFLTLTFTSRFRDANTERAEGWYQAHFPFDNQDLGIGYVVKGDIESPLRVSAAIQLRNTEVEHWNELEQWRSPANRNASLDLSERKSCARLWK